MNDLTKTDRERPSAAICKAYLTNRAIRCTACKRMVAGPEGDGEVHSPAGQGGVYCRWCCPACGFTLR